MNLRFEEIGQKDKRRSALLAARRSWDLRDVSSWPEGRRRGGGEDPWPCDHALTEMMLGSDGGKSIYGSATYGNSIQVGERADVSHYLAVFRRGVKAWTISSLAVVPETTKESARDSAGH